MRKDMLTSVLTAAFILVTLGHPALGFSPYEEFIATEKPTHVALIAAAKDGKGSDLDQALAGLSGAPSTRALKKAHITNLSSYKKVLTDNKTWVMVYFDYDGKDYLQAGSEFEKACPSLDSLVQPHPRAVKNGTTWLQMEWINHIRGKMEPALPVQQTMAMVTRIKLESEPLYRSLHQTVWPGVTDQMARSNNRNFSIYLVEIGAELFEFFYVEYVGKDIAADGKRSEDDPCTQRWWKLTDACQIPLPEVKKGIWAPMDPVKPLPTAK